MGVTCNPVQSFGSPISSCEEVIAITYSKTSHQVKPDDVRLFPIRLEIKEVRKGIYNLTIKVVSDQVTTVAEKDIQVRII